MTKRKKFIFVGTYEGLISQSSNTYVGFKYPLIKCNVAFLEEVFQPSNCLLNAKSLTHNNLYYNIIVPIMLSM